MGVFDVKLVKPELKIGLEVTWGGAKGKIIKLEGYRHLESIFKKEDYVVIELDELDKNGDRILEVQKSSFNYSAKYLALCGHGK